MKCLATAPLTVGNTLHHIEQSLVLADVGGALHDGKNTDVVTVADMQVDLTLERRQDVTVGAVAVRRLRKRRTVFLQTHS